MADIIPSLFGLTPEMYGQQQQMAALSQGAQLANMSPEARGAAMTYAGAAGLGRAVGGMLGAEDPQLQKITQRQRLLTQLDLADPKSLMDGAKIATSSGDAELASGLINRARALQESASKITLQQAQALKAMQPAKLTGEERYIADLRLVETKLLEGKEPTKAELSNANMAAQILAKPRSFFDQASGQTVTIPATDPSKAFPETFKAMVKTEAEGGVAVPKPTTQKATAGNLPSGSQTAIGEIDASLKKLELSAPELQSFLTSLKSGDVTYNATANTFDFLGATVLPAIGIKEKGDQVKKDEIKRALTERVNSLLLMAKGTQTEGDATRASDQIASTTTYLSQARMIGAIEGLMRAESKLASELGAKKASLQSQGKPEASKSPESQEQQQTQTSTIKPSAPKQAPKPSEKPSGWSNLSVDQKIDRLIEYNKKEKNLDVTREQAREFLRKNNDL